jgi:hypothetical protein
MKTLLKICILFIALQTIGACTVFAGSRKKPAAPGTCPSPGNQACNAIAGLSSNAVGAGVNGATISGGGQPGLPNRVTGNFGTVSGGFSNTAGEGSTVSGGSYNAAPYFYSSVGGGTENLSSGPEAAIGGGLHNLASGRRATVSGGAVNSATDIDASVGGGSGNIASDGYATVGGGAQNTSSNVAATVAGGSSNVASGVYSTVAGGVNNVSSEFGAAAGGGTGNLASGAYATIPGGFANQAAGEFSFAAGRRARVAPGHSGTFLFADSNDTVFASQAANEFGIRATGGVRIVTGVDAAGHLASEARLAPGSGAWEVLSDRTAKTGILPVDGHDTLERLMKVSISTWSYRDQAPTVRHMGPVAQDFYSSFGLGEDNRYISTVDADGVALASIQGMYQTLKAQEKQLKTLEAENAAQRKQLDTLETRVSALERTSISHPASSQAPVSWSTYILIGLAVLVVRRQDIKEGINKWLS